MGFFAGFLLYIGASDILPEAHSKARPATVVGLIGLTCLGAAFSFVAVRAEIRPCKCGLKHSNHIFRWNFDLDQCIYLLDI